MIEQLLLDNVGIIDLLIQHRADKNRLGSVGQTPFHHAILGNFNVIHKIFRIYFHSLNGIHGYFYKILITFV